MGIDTLKNKDKEESVVFGEKDCENVGILGFWVVDRVDVGIRLCEDGWI